MFYNGLFILHETHVNDTEQ